MTIGKMLSHEKIGEAKSKDHRTLSELIEVCNTDQGVLITHAAVTVLWHPWMGSKRAGRGE